MQWNPGIGCPFGAGDTILFQGDSLTDAGRTESKDPENHLGNGYVAQLRGLVSTLWPDVRVSFVNRGVGGERTADLLDRWDKDCLGIRPQWLSIMVGVNDVGRKYWPYKDHRFIPAGEYGDNLRELVTRARGGGVGNIVVMSPTFVGRNREDEINVLLDGHADMAERIAKEEGCIWVPVRDVLWKAVADTPEVDWLPDTVHPSTQGHALLAMAWLMGVCGVFQVATHAPGNRNM